LFGDDPVVPPRLGRAEVGVRTAKGRVLNPGRGAASFTDFTLNAYVGCGFGCSYCFAAAFVADEGKREAWGQWVDVKERAVEEVARHRGLAGKSVFMSSATDPYQPLEAKLELTRAIVEILAAKGARLIVQTRSPLATRDIDLFRRFERVRVNMSITTDDDEVRRAFEPACASIDRRFEALAEIRAAGIPVGVSVAPMLPIRDPKAFAERILGLDPARVYSGYFHPPGREFAASTRDAAIAIARGYAWTPGAYEKTRRDLGRFLPNLLDYGR
jgi:DNA repair photolyase